MLLLVSCTAITAGGTPFVSANRAVRLTERAIRLRKRRFRFTVRAVRLRAGRRRKRRNPARNMFHVKQIKGLAVLFGWRSPAGFAGLLRGRSRVVFDVPGGRNQLREHRGFRTAVVTTFARTVQAHDARFLVSRSSDWNRLETLRAGDESALHAPAFFRHSIT